MTGLLQRSRNCRVVLAKRWVVGSWQIYIGALVSDSSVCLWVWGQRRGPGWHLQLWFKPNATQPWIPCQGSTLRSFSFWQSFFLKVSVTEDYILDEDKRFEEAAEKVSPFLFCKSDNLVTLGQIMRLEQRVTCLQNANNVNSCATCRWGNAS